MWKAHKATARQFKFVIFRSAKLRRHKHLGWLALLPEHSDPAGLSVRDGSQFILMLWNIKAKCTFNRSKKFSAAQGPRANDLDHNNAYYSITVHCFAGNRAHCEWFSIGFILYLLWAVELYECHQKTVCHKRAPCKTTCAVFSTPWNILMTLSVRGAGSSHRDPVLESVGTDLNNPHFTRSPGGFHAHLLTAGTRSCCPFSTALTH